MARRTPNEAKPLDLEDATAYTARLQSVQFQETTDAHPDWPDQLKFVWAIETPGAEDQELWTWASIKLGQTRQGKVSKLRTILNALAGRKSNDPVAWLEDGSDGEPIAWGYPDGTQHAADVGLALRIVGHNEDSGDGGSRFVVDQYAAVRRNASASRVQAAPDFGSANPRPAQEPVTADAVPF